ncbi:hypothetical protein [Jatrophihabitans fulvus]
MPFTFTVQKWEKSRPSKAKGSGVAKGITGVLNATKKAPAAMSKSDFAAAQKALTALIDAFDVATNKIRAEKDTKSVDARKDIVTWRKECTDARRVLHVAAFNATFHDTYATNRAAVLSAHSAAAAARTQLAQGGAAPANKDVMNWFGAARNASSVIAKTGILNLSVDDVPKGVVTAADIQLPPDFADTKQKVEDLKVWNEEFAKEAKRAGRAASATVMGNTAVEAELTRILGMYAQVEVQMKPIIQRANVLLAAAQQRAAAVKTAVQGNSSDGAALKRLTGELRQIRTEIVRLDEDVVRINVTYRESKGEIAKIASAWRKMPGYDDQQHGSILTKRQEAAFMGVRRATQPIADCKRQVERAKRLLTESPNHRGYAAALD